MSVNSIVVERQQFKPAVSILDSARLRAMLYSPSIRALSLVPVTSRPLTNFSISRILGLENSEIHQHSQATVFREHQRRNSVRAPSPEHYCSDISPRSSPNSNHSSSTRDCESEPDQLPTPYEQVAKKKRQRTTFSLFEVRELERVFKRQPHLMPEDEEELVQRLGITARSLRYWFQNRRAKSRREGRKFPSDCETNPLDQFRKPVQTLMQPPSNPWRQAERLSYIKENKHSTKWNPPSRPMVAHYPHSSIRSDRLRSYPCSIRSS